MAKSENILDNILKDRGWLNGHSLSLYLYKINY